ncbi:hypothetical protein CASFOL_010852 [Castilleja foliolosa]|uniref:Uncharacterized protein n=1 Tax=Castilleja foliolosa TaxID=1961234 RepID=A0ABD3DUE0_9LAMI
MEERAELRDDDGGGNAKRYIWYKFDLDFPIEKYHFDACMERLRSLFDQLLVAFMNEKSTSNCIRPIPALCGHGRPLICSNSFGWLGKSEDTSPFLRITCGVSFQNNVD